MRNHVSILVTLTVAAGIVAAAQTLASSQPNTVGVSEYRIRRLATSKPMPVYPAESVVRKSSGVAVAAITSGVDGRVTAVTVLQAPDDAIGAAVRDALLKWVIEPMTVLGRPERFGLRGKVTFYFQIAAGRGRVANAEDLPGGPQPEPAGGPPSSAPGARQGGPPTGSPPTVTDHDLSTADIEIGEAEFRQVVATARPTVLDIRERDEFTRGHRDGAVNIPRDELAVRGWIEIDRSRPVVIDCSRAETSHCRLAARTLISGPKIGRVLIFLP